LAGARGVPGALTKRIAAPFDVCQRQPRLFGLARRQSARGRSSPDILRA